MDEKDPFTLVYEAIVEAIATSPLLLSMDASIGSKLINYNTQRKGPPKKRAEDNLPIILVEPEGLQISNQSSTSIAATRSHKILLSCDSYKIIQHGLFQWEWALACVMINANFADAFAQLAWKSYKFVNKVDVVSISSGFSVDAGNKPLNAYATLWDIQVQMSFSRQAMIQYNQGTLP